MGRSLSGGKNNFGDNFNEDLSVEAEGLGTTAIHDFITVNTIREMRKFSMSKVVVSWPLGAMSLAI